MKILNYLLGATILVSLPVLTLAIMISRICIVESMLMFDLKMIPIYFVAIIIFVTLFFLLWDILCE